jgi:uncharacterized protein YndB with AHSA1/START domain
MSHASDSGALVSTERIISAAPHEVFAAFADAEILARWWGPAGFTNTFEQFEFRPDGRWVYVMHAPNGADYPNESVFREIVRDAKVVIEHVVAPRFVLTITLTARGEKTHLRWEQEFETPELAEKMRAVCVKANEENLDRLETVLR